MQSRPGVALHPDRRNVHIVPERSRAVDHIIVSIVVVIGKLMMDPEV